MNSGLAPVSPRLLRFIAEMYNIKKPYKEYVLFYRLVSTTPLSLIRLSLFP